MLRRNPIYRVARTSWLALRAFRRYRQLERMDAASQRVAAGRVHEQTAREFHDLVVDLEGLFVKLAQVLAARDDVMPEPYVRLLGRFHDQVPPRPFREIARAAERSMGRNLDSVFRSVEPRPLAAASLAQVHRAILKSGEPVVLKVQYPEVERLIRVDLANLERIARRMRERFDSFLDTDALLRETMHFLELELDFGREADSTERIARAFADDPRVRIPRVYRELSSQRLLVLEYLEGTPLTDREGLKASKADLAGLARTIAKLYLAMVFEQGFFHGDPHPGNLLLLPDNIVGLLDFGLAKELPDRFGFWMSSLIVKGYTGDRDGALEAARALGFNVDELSPRLLSELLEQAMGNRPIERRQEGVAENAQATVQQRRIRTARQRERLLEIAKDGAKVQVPHHFALIGRTMLLLNGLSDRLAPGQQIVQQTIREGIASAAFPGAH